MALVPYNHPVDSELPSMDSLADVVEAQRELFRSQIGQLERIVVKQCEMTGVNPLSQEMAAGAFSINIGKKPKDLLNPKAIKHMQSVFSLKDNIGKREAREISALCGINVRQVNEYFTSQRSRVRKLLRLSREKASRLDPSSKPPSESLITNPNTIKTLITAQQHNKGEMEMICVNSDPVGIALGPVQQQKEALCVVPLTVVGSESRSARDESSCADLEVIGMDPVSMMAASRSVQNDALLNASRSVINEGASKTVWDDGTGASGSVQIKEGGGVSGALNSMQKVGGDKEEEGGIKDEDRKIVEDLVGLMRRETSFSGQVRLMESVLRINDETALRWFLTKEGLTILLKWLGEAATEEQTSVILVILKVLCHLPLNKAQTTQISAILQSINRLRFYRASDISNRAKMLLAKWSKLLRSQLVKKNPNDSQKDLIRKQRIRELLHGQSWNSEANIPDDILALTANGDEKLPENKKTLRLLNAPYEDLTKKNGSNPSVLENKVKRKVLLVDSQPSTTRVARINRPSTSRPLSADDIQKAKLRASWQKQKQKGNPKSESNLNSEEKMKVVVPVKKEKPVPVVRSVEQPDIDPMNMRERLMRAKIRWRPPPEIKLDPAWQVSSGQNSKESAIQSKRIRRGSETFYADQVTIPPNPLPPWDKELDFDDSLTPQIPIHPEDQENQDHEDQDQDQEDQEPDPGQPDSVGSAGSGPDMELLAVLMKNPDLVFALTEGKVSGDRMVEVMDKLKSSGLSLADLTNGMKNGLGSGSGFARSFPSPTPHSTLERANWNSDYHMAAQPTVHSSPVVSTMNHHNNNVSGFNVQQNQTNVLSLPQITVSMNPPAQHLTSVNTMQNPYLGQNISNHQNMQNFVSSHQHWDQNAGYLHPQNGYNSNSNNNNLGHLMPGQTRDQNQNVNHSQNPQNVNHSQNPDMWGQGRIGESSAVWGYNDQRRNHSNGQNWRR